MKRAFHTAALSTLVVMTLAIARAAQMECRVRQTAGGPKIFVDGERVPPRFFYGDDGMGPVELGREWKRYEMAFRSNNEVKKGTFHLRFPHESGEVEIRALKVTSSAGEEIIQQWSSYPAASKEGWIISQTNANDGGVEIKLGFATPIGKKEDDFHLYLKPQAMKANVDYCVSFEARSTGDIARMRVMGYEIVDGFCHLNIPAADGGSLARTARMASAAGVDFVTFHVRNLWPRDGESIDFTALDRTCRELIAANEKVRLVPRIRIEASYEWFEQHPEMRDTFEDGKQPKISGCVASKEYRAMMKHHAELVCRHMMEKYPKNFAGIHICALSSGGEWFYHDTWSKLGGNDEATLMAYRQYLSERGIEGANEARLPTIEERKNSVGVEGSRLLDTAKDANLMRFNRYRQNLVADTIAEMAHACRVATEGKKLVLVFYGYTFEFAQNWSGPANTGNYALWRLLKSAADDIDILCGPSSYFDRYWAQGSAVMSAAETIERAGVMWLNEDDSSTFTEFRHGPKSEGCKMTLAQNREMLRRNDTKSAMSGYGSWWMDLFGAGWYENEALWQIRSELRPFAEKMCRADAPFSPEVAAIVDEESMMCGIWGSREVIYPLVSQTRAGMTRMGAPYGQYLLADIMTKPIAAKLKLFLSAWYLPTNRRQALRRIMDEDSGVKVWCWAAGWLNENGADLGGIAETTGFKVRRLRGEKASARATAAGIKRGLPKIIGSGVRVEPLFAVDDISEGDEVWATYEDGSPAVVARKRGRGTDVFEGLPIALPAEFLAAVARLAGAHLYVEPKTALVWENGGYTMVQPFEDGEFTITWPDGYSCKMSMKKGECKLIGPNEKKGNDTLPAVMPSAWLDGRTKEIKKTAQAKLESAKSQLKECRDRLETAFAGAEGTIESERTFKRLEIAVDTCRFVETNLKRGDAVSMQFVERGLEDIGQFIRYLGEEVERWEASPLNPKVESVVLNVRDFGAVGDGKTANYEAFSRVFAAAQQLGGKPCLIKIPAGEYYFNSKEHSQKYRHECQFAMSALTNVVLVGESPATTKFVWGVYDCSGGIVEMCDNVTLKNIQFYWREYPFTEGMVSEVNADEGWCVMKANPLAKMPDELCFKGALSCQFDTAGKMVLESSFAWLDAKRPVEKLGDGKYRLYFNRTKFGESYRKVRKDCTICIPNRDNKYHSMRWLGGCYVTFDSLWFRNSRAAAFSTAFSTRQSCATNCRIFPMEGCVLSTCADGYYASPGSYMAHCDFEHMHDDGNNSHSYGVYIYAQPEKNALIFKASNGIPKRGDLMLIISPANGQYLGNVRVAENAEKLSWNGERGFVKVRYESLPAEIKSFDSLGMAALTREDQNEIIFGRKKVDRMPDIVYMPSFPGIGSVVSNNRIASLRNVALPVQSANELVESNRIEYISTGINLTALVQWLEGPPPYHTIVRGNVIRGCGHAIQSLFCMPDHKPAKTAPIRDCRFEGNCIIDSQYGAMKLHNLSNCEFIGNEIIGGKVGIITNNCEYLKFAD